jgi:hypothetical protein
MLARNQMKIHGEMKSKYFCTAFLKLKIRVGVRIKKEWSKAKVILLHTQTSVRYINNQNCLSNNKITKLSYISVNIYEFRYKN